MIIHQKQTYITNKPLVGTGAVSTAGLSLFIGFLPLLPFCLCISDGSSVCSACNDVGVKMDFKLVASTALRCAYFLISYLIHTSFKLDRDRVICRLSVVVTLSTLIGPHCLVPESATLTYLYD